MSELSARNIATQVLSALVYLQNKNFVHRDIKPDNILLNQDYDLTICHVKLCDFGFSREISENMQSRIGTPYYSCSLRNYFPLVFCF